jgi:drug/metabolite transporter (DMT)-like permease
VRAADLVLLVANLVYATSYVVTRVALDHLPPAFLALGRLAIAAAVLWPVVRTLEASATAPARRDAWRIAAMGAVGFAGAYACSHWGLAGSTATNAALLIIVEPVSIMLLSPRCSASVSAGGRRSAPPWPSSVSCWSCSTACPD